MKSSHLYLARANLLARRVSDATDSLSKQEEQEPTSKHSPVTSARSEKRSPFRLFEWRLSIPPREELKLTKRDNRHGSDRGDRAYIPIGSVWQGSGKDELGMPSCGIWVRASDVDAKGEFFFANPQRNKGKIFHWLSLKHRGRPIGHIHNFTFAEM